MIFARHLVAMMARLTITSIVIECVKLAVENDVFPAQWLLQQA